MKECLWASIILCPAINQMWIHLGILVKELMIHCVPCIYTNQRNHPFLQALKGAHTYTGNNRTWGKAGWSALNPPARVSGRRQNTAGLAEPWHLPGPEKALQPRRTQSQGTEGKLNSECTGTAQKQRQLVSLCQGLLLRHDGGVERKLGSKGCFYRE